ncbi:hypothetical protein NHX12_026685 [Muraenolepis orangiensis]|uniref:SOCS box domain-containing protein n=1 Tax=Muraenolepis orangiensis TaxID=630683 RepID=A0A9Q0EMU3_9TELE|nr:hypothetical protein NHX12_026685 [Muraenolepis orangiensis]
MELDDYSLYGDLSDEELIQLTIERSLAEEHFESSHQPPPPPPPDVPTAPSPSPSLAQDDITEIESMIHRGDKEALLVFVKEHPDSSRAINGEGWTSLHEAAYFGQLGCLKILIEMFPDMVNRCSPRNQTALLLAAYRGHPCCVEYLLDHGANPNMANKERESPLFKACERGSERMVELLLRSGASVNHLNDQGATAFQEATRHDHLKICEMLLRAGANLCTTNLYGVQPIFTAAQSGSVNVLNFLLSKDVNVNKQARDGATPLYEACKNGYIAAVETLLSHHADANVPTKSGLLPLHAATRKSHVQIVSMLLPLTRKDGVASSGLSPLHLAAEQNRDDLLELLIGAGYDVNSQLSQDRCQLYEDRRTTALYFSVDNNNLEACEMLLEAGADPNLDFFNPLLMAIRKGAVELVALLLRYGANVNAQISTHRLSFPSAIQLGMDYIPLLKLLLDHGCHARGCFHCDYGSKTHPHFDPLWQRQELRYRTPSPTAHCVQFCEALSCYSTCTPGPIISLLLDYVGHVKLCSRLLELLDGCCDETLIRSKAVPPRPLMQLCRLRIREILGAEQLNSLDTLPIPPRLQRFLWYRVEYPSESNMASVSASDSWSFEDYSSYSQLSDDQLLQLAIERSLTDNPSLPANQSQPGTQSSAPTGQPGRPSTGPNRANPPTSQNRDHNAHYSSHNPPVEKPPDPKSFDGTISHFVTGQGQRMMAYRRTDGVLVHVCPEPEEEDGPLFTAIRRGDVRQLRTLVSQQHSLMSSRPGWMAVHDAAWYGQEGCLNILLTAEPGMINKRTGAEQTALHLAVSSVHVGCARLLLERGADPELMNKDRETPLYKACETENAEMVALLLNHGVSVNTHCIQGWTALQEAVSRNDVEICEMLVKAGARLTPSNVYGISPLFTAAQSGNVATLRFLLKHGADVDSQAADGATALYEATKNGHQDIVELLLSQKADANKANKRGLLALHTAAQRGDSTLVSMLIPATSTARVRRCGISPLHLAAEHNMDDVLELLIRADFDVNAQLSLENSKMYEDRRTTALYFSVANNNVEAVRMLLEAGADPNLDIFNPLLVATRLGCIQTVTMLIRHGAHVNAYLPTHPTTFPATVLFAMKYLTMLKFILDNGCDALACFSCTHGSGPHPPLKLNRFQRDELRYTESSMSDSADNHSVQFCEMVSIPSMCQWAGPIIDVLLNYVGQVRLCSRLQEHLDSFPDWHAIKDKATAPRPLMQLCRLEVRRLVGAQRLKRLGSLPLPGSLLRFLQHQEGCTDFY